MNQELPAQPVASRRAVLAGAGAAAVVVLSGCATYGPGNGGDAGNEPEPAGSEPPGGGTAFAQTGDIPVGGGKVFDQQKVVVTQPQAGTFKAFTAICTHQGCTVAEVRDGTINCPCHGSRFKVADGSVAIGPATRALRSIDINVEGTGIALA